jgi:hypothetical protein
MNNLENMNYDIDLSDGVITFKTSTPHMVLLGIMKLLKLNISLLIPFLDVKALQKKLLNIVEKKTKIKPTPQDPISPFR